MYPDSAESPDLLLLYVGDQESYPNPEYISIPHVERSLLNSLRELD